MRHHFVTVTHGLEDVFWNFSSPDVRGFILQATTLPRFAGDEQVKSPLLIDLRAMGFMLEGTRIGASVEMGASAVSAVISAADNAAEHLQRRFQHKPGQAKMVADLLEVTQHSAQHFGVGLDLSGQLILLHPLPPRQCIQCDHPQPNELRL